MGSVIVMDDAVGDALARSLKDGHSTANQGSEHGKLLSGQASAGGVRVLQYVVAAMRFVQGL